MTGRNDPCPCGSGKKYKKCCLKKDEEARRAADEAARDAREAEEAAARRARQAALERSPASRPVDESWKNITSAGDTDDALEAGLAENEELADESATDPLDARWEAFAAEEDYEGKIAIYVSSIDDGVMDAENAFEMLAFLHGASARRGERDRFDALLALLRQHLPDIYAENAQYYTSWLVANALITGRMDALPGLVETLVDTAGTELDTFSSACDQLAYYGQLHLLPPIMRRALPSMRGAGKFFDWAIDQFAREATMFAVLDYIEQTAQPDAAALDEIGAGFGDVDVCPGGTAQFLAHITGQANRRWSLADFDFAVHKRHKGQPQPATDQSRLNLFHLTVEFLGDLRRTKGVSYAKGELARYQIEKYLLDRHAGELDRQSQRPLNSKGKTHPAATVHPLCPDCATLDIYLGDRLHIFAAQPYRAAALFEMIPLWLRFLETHGLLDPAQREVELSEMRELAPDLLTVLDKFSSDPALQLVLKHWPARDGLV